MWEWLNRPFFSLYERAKIFVYAFIFTLAWNIGFVILTNPYIPNQDRVANPTLLGWISLPIVALAVVLEELVRLVALDLTRFFLGRGPFITYAAMLVTAALFGAVHVTNGLPLWFVLLCQGMTGLVMNVLYLKGGALQGNREIGFAYAYVFHVVFDFSIMIPALLSRS